MHSIYITENASQKMQEIFGVKKFNAQRKIANNARIFGLGVENFSGAFRDFLEKLKLTTPNPDIIKQNGWLKVYDQVIFIFDNEKLVTVWKTKPEFKKETDKSLAKNLILQKEKSEEKTNVVQLRPQRKVRKANIKDEEELMQLCRELHEENGLFAMNEDLVRANLRHAFMNNGGVIGVIGEPGKIEAAIYIKLGTFWYSHDLHLEELFVYVRKKYRATTNAKDLILFAKNCSEELDIPLVTGIITNDRTEAKVRLYERNYNKKAGAFFVYNSKFNH